MSLPVIKTLKLSDVKGKEYSFGLPLGGFGISRHFLDNNLCQIALAKGVTVCAKSKVNSVSYSNDEFIISSPDKTIRAKIAAGSFGKRSNLDVKWKRPFIQQKPTALNNYIGIKYHINYPHPVHEIALHNFSNGYCGMSKVEDAKSCLCYLTTAGNLQKCGNSIKEMEKQVLHKNPRLKEIFNSASFIYDQPLAISQISFSKKNQVENRVLMLGDAAGMISPLCGNGMSMAMHSGKLAFEAMQRFLYQQTTREEMEKEYAQTWKEEFSKRLLAGRMVQRFFGGNQATSFFIRAMHAFPSVARRVIQSTHGEAF